MTVNDIICALGNCNDFNFTIQQEGRIYGVYFENYNDIPTEYLDADIKQFCINGEKMLHFLI